MTRKYEYMCDWCTDTISTSDVTSLPDGWQLVLIGDDNRGNKWHLKRHICPGCWRDPSTPLLTGYVHAPETPTVQE